MTRRCPPLSRSWLQAVVALCWLLCPVRPAEAACTVTVSAGVKFGAYDVFNPQPLDTTGYLSYRCDQWHNYVVRISLTRGQSTSYAARTLGVGTDLLQYNLFLDAARTLVWGDGSAGTGVFTDSGVGLTRNNLPIYARIRAGQDSKPGAYSDSVTVVIDF